MSEEPCKKSQKTIHCFFKSNNGAVNTEFKEIHHGSDTHLLEFIANKFHEHIQHLSTQSSVFKIAAFDLDFTLIRTKFNTKYPKNEFDWKWCDAKVPQELLRLSRQGFVVVIFTNQAGLSNQPKRKEQWIRKLKSICQKLHSVPLLVFAASHKPDHHRKPMIGMWNMMKQRLKEYSSKDNISISTEDSIFVGDAAGRPDRRVADNAYKQDHSCSDYKFSLNLGIAFATPNTYFGGEIDVPTSAYQLGINPFDYLDSDNERKVSIHFEPCQTGHFELILMCGRPASGKSTFFRRHIVTHGYKLSSCDVNHSMTKCIQQCSHWLFEKKSVCVDNTNPTVAARKKFIDIAKQYDAQVRCLYFEMRKELSYHLNYVRWRGKLAAGDHTALIVPRVAFATFDSHFTAPSTSEGFSSIETIPFVAEFDDKLSKQHFATFYESKP